MSVYGKSFLHVTHPAPESYYIVPSNWKAEDITVVHGELFHKGMRSFIVPHDFYSRKQSLELIDENHMEYSDFQDFINKN